MELRKEDVRALITPKDGKFSCGLRDLELVSGDNEKENEDGGPGSGNFGHEGREGEIGGSAPGEPAAEQCGKISVRLEEINGVLSKCLADMASGERPIEELIKEAQALTKESESLKAKLEELNPNSRTNVSRRLSAEGHPTQEEIMESLPEEWRDAYSTAEEQTYGESFKAKINYWSGEGYREMKDDLVLSKAIELSSAKWSKGELYRGLSMSDEQLASLVPGSSLQMHGLSSWSSDVSPSMSFATTEQNPVLIVDKTSGTRNALPIAQMSGRSWEKEVVYGKDQRFRVKTVSTQEVAHGTSATGSSTDFSKQTSRKVTVVEVEAE